MSLVLKNENIQLEFHNSEEGYKGARCAQLGKLVSVKFEGILYITNELKSGFSNHHVTVFFFFKQKTAYEISECDWSSTCALPITRRFFFFKQKTAYEISECDWSSDVCSSD